MQLQCTRCTDVQSRGKAHVGGQYVNISMMPDTPFWGSLVIVQHVNIGMKSNTPLGGSPEVDEDTGAMPLRHGLLVAHPPRRISIVTQQPVSTNFLQELVVAPSGTAAKMQPDPA